jgi:hypothetical protein
MNIKTPLSKLKKTSKWSVKIRVKSHHAVAYYSLKVSSEAKHFQAVMNLRLNFPLESKPTIHFLTTSFSSTRMSDKLFFKLANARS